MEYLRNWLLQNHELQLYESNPNANEHLLHFGGHGGNSVDEVFVPLLEIPLNAELLRCINERFLSKM